MTFDFKKGPKGDTGEPGAPGASTWGSITGTLSAQTDLATALGLRLLASNNLSDLGSASAARTNLGLGTLATQNGTLSEYLTIANAASTYAPLVHNQDWSTLTGIPSAITTLSNATAAGLALMDDADASAQRTTLGLGSIATQAANNVNITGGSLSNFGGILMALTSELRIGNAFTGARALAISGTPGNLVFRDTTNAVRQVLDSSASGVQAALNVAVGSAGAFVTNGGELGTPSSATLTNATGLPLATGVTGALPLANIAQAGATTGQAIAWNGSAWAPATIAAGATLAANTFTGLQQFSGTTHAGLRLNNLTTVQRDAIASPSAGMAIWNTTASRLQLHNGSGWTAGMVRLDGDAMTGALTITNSAATTSAPLFATTQNWSGATAALTAKTNNVVDSRTGGSIGGFLETWAVGGTPVFCIHRGDQFGNGAGGLSGNNINPIQFVYNGLPAAMAGANFAGSGVGIQFASTSNGFLSFANAQNWAVQHGDLHLGRGDVATLQLGKLNATSPTNQTIKGHDVTTGTGAKLCLGGGRGSVAGGAVSLATSATNGALVEHLLVRSDGVIDFASASLTTESVTSNRTLTVRVGGTLVKLLAFV